MVFKKLASKFKPKKKVEVTIRKQSAQRKLTVWRKVSTLMVERGQKMDLDTISRDWTLEHRIAEAIRLLQLNNNITDVEIKRYTK